VEPLENPERWVQETQLASSREFGVSLPKQIAEAIADEIVERRLKPGTKLPEPAMADRFGTSRAPIREALYLLSQGGLVDRSPRKGAIVKGYDEQEIWELYQVRSVLEKLALERICEEPTTIQACLTALDPIAREMEQVEKDAKRYHELNFSFHKTIIVLSQSDLLSRLYSQIEGPLKVVLRRTFSTEGAVPKSFGEHLQLIDAIERAEVQEACRILRKHDEDGMRRAIASLSMTSEDPEEV
jgi:DNA-binding GntR family transcriptional regulator